MKRILFFLLALSLSVVSFAQTTAELSNIVGAPAGSLHITGAAAQSTLNNNIINATAGATATDLTTVGVITYRSYQIQINGSAGIASGQIIIEGSNDGTNFFTLQWFDDAVTTAAVVNAATSIAASTFRTFSGSTYNYRYIRCRISTAFSGGTVQAFTTLSPYPYQQKVNVVGQATAANLQATATQGGTWTVQPGNTANTTAWYVALGARTTNGTSTHTLNSAATTNGTSIKGTAGAIYGVTIMNTSAATKYVRFYNKATAPTVGTDVPIMVIAVPATSSKEIYFPGGMVFTTGIGYSITNAASATDATAVAAGDVQLFISWI